MSAGHGEMMPPWLPTWTQGPEGCGVTRSQPAAPGEDPTTTTTPWKELHSQPWVALVSHMTTQWPKDPSADSADFLTVTELSARLSCSYCGIL